MSSRHPHHRPGTRASSRTHEASDGLIASLLLPLRGAGIGWALLFGGFGIVWMIAVEVLAWFSVLAWPAIFALLAVFYTLALRFATACFNGARAGDDEPDLTDVPQSGAAAWLVPGALMMLYLFGCILAVGVSLAVIAPGPVGSESAAVFFVALGLATAVFAPFAASVGLAAARGSAVAMFALPSVFRLVAASGGRYIVPLLIGTFAGAAPYAVVSWAQAHGGSWAFLLTATTTMISGYSFGAIGASMGWLARVDPDAADVLDG